MKVIIAGIERHSFVNGPGTRYVVFFQGCTHRCEKCQNPDTWDIEKGKIYDTDDIVNDILSTKYLDGVTFSGGDPLLQAKALSEMCKKLKEKNINIWCYTGWTYEALENNVVSLEAKEALDHIDVLIDGPFIYSLFSDKCIYRGSTNQRIIDIRKSREEKRVVLLDEFDYGL